MVSIAEGYSMMYPGLDEDDPLLQQMQAIGSPGLDLINKRRQEQLIKEAIAASQSENITGGDDITGDDIIGDYTGDFSLGGAWDSIKDTGTDVINYLTGGNLSSNIDDLTDSILTEKGQELKDIGVDKAKSFVTGVGNVVDDPLTAFSPSLSIAKELGLLESDEDSDPLYTINLPEIGQNISDWWKNDQALKMIKEGVSGMGLYAKDKLIDPYFVSDNDPMTWKADGGRIGMFMGGNPHKDKDAAAPGSRMGSGEAREAQARQNTTGGQNLGGGGGGQSTLQPLAMQQAVDDYQPTVDPYQLNPALMEMAEMDMYTPSYQPVSVSAMDSLNSIFNPEFNIGGGTLDVDVDPSWSDPSIGVNYTRPFNLFSGHNGGIASIIK